MAKRSLKAISQHLLDYALALPEATLDHPWGENVAKVKKKVFVFFGVPGMGEFGMSVKLPNSGGAVLMSPFAKPTGYGLGKSGWVSMTFGPKDELPVPLMESWIVESYRAIAPAKLADSIGAPAPAAKKKAPAAKKKAPAAKKKAPPAKKRSPAAPKKAAGKKVSSRSR